jgi:8-oxo-dGTP diphosphatase
LTSLAKSFPPIMPQDPPAPFGPGATRRIRPTVRVGIGVVVLSNKQDGLFYAGIRQGSHGSGTLALPGGHLEMYESWESCAIREVKEEMGIEVENPRILHVTNDIMETEGKHYVTIFMGATSSNPKIVPQNCEPKKCQGWNTYRWEDVKSLPADQLFGPLRQLVEQEPQDLIEFLTCATKDVRA